jgi:hypothetical protein
MGRAYLRVEKPPDPTFLTSFSPAQNTDEHEGNKDEVRDKSRKEADFDVLRMLNRTYTSSPIPSGCGHA